MAARVGRGKRRISGPHRVAVILRLLDEEVAMEVLRELGDRDLARINRADSDLGQPTEDVVRGIAAEFKERLFGGGHELAGVQSKRVESLIRQAFDEERLEAILGREDIDIGRISDTLVEIDPRVIGRILTREYPQTCALILSQLPSVQASQVLLSLPEELRIDVIMRLARMEKIGEDMLEELNRALEREIAGFEGASQAQEMEGVDLAVQLFMNMDRTNEAALLDAIAEQDEEIADLIRERMFTFDDLLGVDDRGIQTVLRNIDNQTLVLALKGAEPEMLDKFLSNVSKRVSASLVEDLETMGPVRLSEVENSQQKIANIAREMVDRGEIVIPGRGEDELV
jgi:flagellar motor switch protein FliG